jgi:hypothetical protein
MEDLGITDHAVYRAQPARILAYRRAIRAKRAELRQIEIDRARAMGGRR